MHLRRATVLHDGAHHGGVSGEGPLTPPLIAALPRSGVVGYAWRHTVPELDSASHHEICLIVFGGIGDRIVGI